MEKKVSNKFTFGLGILFIAGYGISIFLDGFKIERSLFFVYGIYLVYQNGFVRDITMWKYNPSKILAICLLATFLLLYIFRTQNSESKELSKIDIVRELVYKAKDKLPIDLGNGDSLIDVIAINETTLKYVYKMKKSLDSINIPELKKNYEMKLNERFNSFDVNKLNQWRKSNISFLHEFNDHNGKFAFNVIIKSGKY